jgi:ATP-dependent Clp protease ATP-binding subunit ClpC
MLCDRCHKRHASIHITRIVNGKKNTKNLCTQCAVETGAIPDSGMGINEIIPGFGDLGNFSDVGGLFDFPDVFANLFKRRPADRIFDYFSADANRIIHLAAEEAKRLGHDHLRSEHLLLALIKEEGFALKVLKNLGVDSVNLFSDLESLIGRGEGTPPQISLSPRAKKILELAFTSAKELGFNYVGPEHILLGIIREGEGVAAQALHKRKVSFEKTAREILKEVEKAQSGEMSALPRPEQPTDEIGPDEAEEGPEDFSPEDLGDEGQQGGMFFGGFPGGMAIGQPPKKKPALSNFGRDITALARNGELDPVIDRDKETDRVIRILSRRTKNNPVLIGDPGVGKTAIVEGFAERIVKGEVPESLKDKQVIALDLAGMIAGTKYRGEFEARIKKMMDEILSKKRQVILFIDELHTLVGAGGAEGAIDASNMLKPALAKGDLQVVGATTINEYRKYIEKDPALERRFQPVQVNEPDVELTIQILKGIRDKYEAHHRVKIPDAAIIAAATLSDRYVTDRFLPDKAIDLMDEAAAKVRLRTLAPNKDVKESQKALIKLRTEKEAALAKQEYEKAAKLRDQISELEKKYQATNEKANIERATGDATVTEDDIAEIVSDWTGIPVVKLTEAETAKLIKMEEHLHERVIGQEEAIKVISQAIRRGRAGLKAPEKPLGAFIFAGPTGVGKTEVARRLAEFLFGTQEALVRLDMSEYMEKFNASRLVGAPPGYVGYEEGGTLTEAVRRKPYSVILFDEIEKAHPDIFNILLQILDDGRLTDSKGKIVDFKNTVIIMTTNIGQREVLSEGPIGFVTSDEAEANYEKMKANVMDAMKREFRPEFLNRIDEIVVFHPLLKEELIKIIDLLVHDVSKNASDKEIYLEVDDKAKELIINEGYDPKFGARPLRRAIQKLIENPLSNDLLEGKFKPGDIVLAKGVDKRIEFEKTGSKPVKKPEDDTRRPAYLDEDKLKAAKAATSQAESKNESKSDKPKRKKTS